LVCWKSYAKIGGWSSRYSCNFVVHRKWGCVDHKGIPPLEPKGQRQSQNKTLSIQSEMKGTFYIVPWLDIDSMLSIPLFLKWIFIHFFVSYFFFFFFYMGLLGIFLDIFGYTINLFLNLLSCLFFFLVYYIRELILSTIGWEFWI